MYEHLSRTNALNPASIKVIPLDFLLAQPKIRTAVYCSFDCMYVCAYLPCVRIEKRIERRYRLLLIRSDLQSNPTLCLRLRLLLRCLEAGSEYVRLFPVLYVSFGVFLVSIPSMPARKGIWFYFIDSKGCNKKNVF